MSAANEVKVSVVVPVYNPGEHIDALIESLAAQSLPPSAFEVVFVDDGSTDDTPERLAEACARHANMRTSTIPNSGWPGRPRNVGTDLAVGDYVFYADNDDELYPEALERMHELAVENGSDIVYGKIVRTGRPTPYWQLWHRTIGRADPVADHLVASRTVHKLFRRQFLVDHGIRFPEGRVRLEDFAFMGQAIPQAQVISVLADYPCYRWIHRSDGTNNSTAVVQQSVYWDYFTGALQTLADNAGEGSLLDAARVVAAEQAFSRFAPSSYLKRTPEAQQEVFTAVHDYVAAQLPSYLDDRLPVLKRLRVQALRSGDKDRFDAIQRLRQELTTDLVVDSVGWQGDSLHLVVRALLGGSDAVSLLQRTADGALALVPDLDAPEPARRLRPEDEGTLELTVRHRGTGLEWPMTGVSRLEPVTTGNGVRLRVHVEAQVDPGAGCFGEPLDDGIWDLMARSQFLGESGLVALPAPSRPAIGTVSSGDRQARAYVTEGGKLALKLTRETAGGHTGHPVVRAATWDGSQLRIHLSGAPRTGASIATRARGSGEAAVVVPVRAGAAVLQLDHLRVGDPVDAYLRLESAAGVRDERLNLGPAVTLEQHAPYAVSAGPTGALSLRRLARGEPVPGPVTVAASSRARPHWAAPTAQSLARMLPQPVKRILRGARPWLKARLR